MDPDFITAVGPDGNKRYVPRHYLDNPAFGFKLPPSSRVTEPVETPDAELVREPVEPGSTGEKVEEPAAATPKTTKRSGAAGENKEASS
jgi:hypothetical protein